MFVNLCYSKNIPIEQNTAQEIQPILIRSIAYYFQKVVLINLQSFLVLIIEIFFIFFQ